MDATQPRRGRFFAWSAIVIAVIVVLSFPLTYYGPLLTGSRTFLLLHHLHGLAFFAWIALYLLQTQLISRGQVRLHREIGLAGIALTGAMLPLGLWMAVAVIERRISQGHVRPFEFTIYNLIDITVFCGVMGWAIAETRRRIDWHRRLAFIAVLNLMGPAASRWFFVTPIPFPWVDMMPNLFADAFLFALAWHDRRTLGQVHPVTLIAAMVLIPLHVVEPFIARSQTWNALAPMLFGFG